MKYSLIIRPEAEIDLQDAFQWYQKQEKGLGLEFLRCIDASLSLINRSPEMFHFVHKKIRRILIRRFPYGVFYLLENNRIIVLAVLHVRRHPKRWKRRN